MNKNYAVILSGCGAKDGSEIQEAVCALIAIAKAGNNYTIFAPDILQKHVINHINDSEIIEPRNVLIESARIARGDINDLEMLDVSKFDGLIIPGGFGAAKNLFDFAFNYMDFIVLPIMERVVMAFYDAGKPIGAMCISPVLIAKLLGHKQVSITLGDESDLCKDIENRFGAKVIVTEGDGVLVDEQNKIVTTPSYMYGSASILNIALGAERMIIELDKL